MFNKEGIPFFVIMIPFLSIIFIAFFTVSYYLKLSDENFDKQIKEYKTIYLETDSKIDLKLLNKRKEEIKKKQEDEFIKFMEILTISILVFMAMFTILMVTIISDTVKKYKKQVEEKEKKLQKLNKSLSFKVQKGIEEAKRKDKTILQQSKLARMGSMISMIAHQWRQPLTELSGILMELETATRFKKVTEDHVLRSIEKSDKTIEFMSKTIDDFRNFYKPDKKKVNFYLLDSCNRAINLISATLKENGIMYSIEAKKDKKIYGYPTEFSQVILNLLANAKDILIEKNIENPQIKLSINTKGINAIIKVKDNAGGIKEENFDDIFDPYYSTKSSSKGTGLGLYISKLIVERNMGGQLSVYNDNEGAVFKIILVGYA